MVDRAEFFKIADEILAESGREPSQRAIRERLARGGSFSELGPLFVHWATARFILNEGRQKLFGNVGYRIIEANIEELLREPSADQAIWC